MLTAGVVSYTHTLLEYLKAVIMSAREVEDTELKNKIPQVFTENKGRYGSHCIFNTLKNTRLLY